MRNLEQVINEKFNQTIKYIRFQPINLGGAAASGGGTGGPPGGFIGYLPQGRVAYDMTEAGTLVTMSGVAPSGASILDNLNHIRYRIGSLETTMSGILASGSGIPGVDVYDSGVFVASGISKLNFADGLIITQTDDDTVEISSTCSGSGTQVVVYSGVYCENLSDQIDGLKTTFTVSGTFIPNSLSIYINGLKQSRDYYSETETGVELVPVLEVGDSLTVDYDMSYLYQDVHTHDYVTTEYLEDNYTNTSDLNNLLSDKLDSNTPIVGATATKITYDSDGLITSGTDATTADIDDSANRRYVTDAQLIVISNTSNTNTGDQTLPTDQTIVTTDNVVNNASTSKHGWFPKLPTPSGLYLKDDLTWGTPTSSGSGSTTLAELTDVSIPTPEDGEVLTFDSGTNKWVSQPVTTSGVGIIYRQTILTFSEELTVSDNPLRIYNLLPTDQTITKVFLAVGTPPTGSSMTVDIHKNGTTIFTDQGNRPLVLTGEYTGYTETIDIPTWSGGEYLTAHIDAIGSTVAGSNLVVHIIHY